MIQDELNKILENHLKWLKHEDGGECADLHGMDLSGMFLSDVNLWGANLTHANLSCTNLRNADLTHVNLSRANRHTHLHPHVLTI